MPAPTISDTPELDVNDFDLFWDADFMLRDILPATLFDTSFPFTDLPAEMQPPRTTNFYSFSSRLPPLDIANDDDDHA